MSVIRDSEDNMVPLPSKPDSPFLSHLFFFIEHAQRQIIGSMNLLLRQHRTLTHLKISVVI